MKTNKTLLPTLGVYLLLLLSCFSRAIPLCDGPHLKYRIDIGETNMLRVSCFLDTGYKDISCSLREAFLIPDKVNRYVNLTDTITLQWYYNYGYYADSLMQHVLRTRLADKLGKPCDEAIEPVDYEEFMGYMVSYIYQGRHEIMVYGSDVFSRVYLMAEFSSKTNNSGRGQMECLLNSLRFR